MKELKTRKELIERLESNLKEQQDVKEPVIDENIKRYIKREVARQTSSDLLTFLALFGDKL